MDKEYVSIFQPSAAFPDFRDEYKDTYIERDTNTSAMVQNCWFINLAVPGHFQLWLAAVCLEVLEFNADQNSNLFFFFLKKV